MISLFPNVSRGLFVAVVAASCLVAAPLESAAQPVPQVKFAALMVDAVTGETLHQEMDDQLRYPASLTKIMTLYIAFDEVAAGRLEMDDRIQVSAKAASQPPSKLGVRPGDSLSVEEGLNAIAIKSANDIAVAMAERISGSEAAFAQRMTRQARALGMADTNFRNASGLPDSQQVTTARDMAVLARAMLRDHPQHYAIFSQPSFDFRGQTIYGHNRVTHRLAGADGLKTGYINASGFNLVTSASRDGRRLVGVVMGGRSADSRDRYMESLFNDTFTALTMRSAKRPLTFTSGVPISSGYSSSSTQEAMLEPDQVDPIGALIARASSNFAATRRQ